MIPHDNKLNPWCCCGHKLLNVGEIIQNEKKNCHPHKLGELGGMIEIRRNIYYFHKLLEVDGMVERWKKGDVLTKC